jgi:protein-disulfide isomerase
MNFFHHSSLRFLIVVLCLGVYACTANNNQVKEESKQIQPAVEVESFCEQGKTPIYKVGIPKLAPIKGSREKALVTIIAFTEFQCPFCARVVPTLDEILAHYGDKVRLVVRHNPLAFHKNAMPAAKAAMAAARQGKFWPMHDLLFENNRSLDEDSLFGYASRIGLDMKKFTADFESAEIAKQIQFDMDEAKKLGARGVPMFYINGRIFSGAQPFDDFKRFIDDLLPAAERVGSRGDALYRSLVECGYTENKVEEKPRPRVAPAADTKVYKLPLEDSYILGAPQAKIKIFVFTDFQCPYCRKAYETVTRLLESYPKRVALILKHFPLPFHKDAYLAHQAVLAAGAQGKFWQMHDLLFANQRQLTYEDLEKYAAQLGLDMTGFKKDLDTTAFAKIVDRDISLGKELGVTGTPTLFIDGKKMVGAQAFDVFKAEVEAALSD